tara:strand:- start:1288 stop:1809 length:522 start_codon:yes stop_codon:yes gene_type:complete
MTISTTLDSLLPVAGSFNVRHHQSIADNVSNRNLITFVQENTDPAAIDSLTEILTKAQTDKTDILNITSLLEAKHDAELASLQTSLQTAITAAETKHDNELAAESAARQVALVTLEAKHDLEKSELDSAIAAESAARAAKDVEIEAAHAADKAETNSNLVKVGNILTEAFKAQ